MSPSLQTPSPKIEYEGNKYSRLSRKQQSRIYEGLLDRRHSMDILRADRHVLENEELPPSIAKKTGLGLQDFAAAPKRYSSTDRRKAVSIDCEWGRAKSRRSELLAICAIDVLTGETLINSLVAPSQPLLNWRDHIHGITQDKIEAAVQRNQCLQGWRQARAKLFEYIDEQTILVGHIIGTDLELLRLFHTSIVDSQVVAALAVFTKRWGKAPWPPRCPIQKVCRDFLDITLKQHNPPDRYPVDVFENALLSREIVLQCIQRPRDFEAWARQERAEFWKPHNKKKDFKRAEMGSDSNTGSNKKTALGSISDKGQVIATFSHKYEAGYGAAYEAGFKSGFQMGYERGYEQANTQGNQALTKDGELNQAHSKNKDNYKESIQYAGEENCCDDQLGTASQDGSHDDDWAMAAESGLLAQLMKDDKIREMVQRANDE